MKKLLCIFLAMFSLQTFAQAATIYNYDYNLATKMARLWVDYEILMEYDAFEDKVSYEDYLLKDGSYTTLTANTPNDGNETITLPASLENTYNGRIKIEAVNNIFYTVSKPLTIWDPAMSNESFEKQTLKIFPNPAKDVLNISFSSEKNGRTQYSIFDLNGRLVKTFEKEHFEQSHHQITIDFLASGTYVLIVNHNGKSSSHKFIKQ